MTVAAPIAPSRRARAARVVAVLLALLPALVPGGPVAAEPTPPPGPVLEGEPPPAWPSPPALDVPAFVLVEGATGQVLAAHAADERRHVASTIKILTALSVLDRVDGDEVVTVGREVVGVGGASVQLRPGDRWSVDELLQGMLVRSGNDAAEALAVHVAGSTEGLVALMREDAEVLGLPTGPDGIVLTDPTGLADGNRLSALDLATLARAALAHPTLRPLLAAETVSLPGIGTDRNRNELLGSYRGATGVKTGYTDAAGFSLVASARRGDRELVAVVLGAGPDPARFRASAALLDHGFAAYRAETVEREVTLLAAGGHVPLAIAPTTVTVPVDADLEVALAPPVWLPTDPILVEVVVDGVTVGALSAQPAAPPPPEVEGAAGIGRGLVDGAYAALRAATGADTW